MSEKEDSPTRNGSTDREVRLLVLGQDGVGKTAIVVRYLTRRFIGDYDPTSEGLYTTTTSIDGKPTTLHVLDTAAKDEVRSIREEQIRWADGFMLVFSLTDTSSIQAVVRYRDLIQQVRREKRIPMLLLANKCDMIHVRLVSERQARNLATELNCTYLEVSARDSFSSASNAFYTLYKDIRTVQRKREKIRKLLQAPSMSRIAQLRDTLRNFKDKHLRTRTHTV